MSLEKLRRIESQGKEESDDATENHNEGEQEYHEQDDEFEMEEDKRRILKELTAKYEDFSSLKTQDQFTTLSETLLEFELEKLLRDKKEYIQQRASNQLKLSADTGAMISSVSNDGCNYMTYRNKRESTIQKMMQKPKLDFPKSECTRIQREINLASQKRNTKACVFQMMKHFYSNWITTLCLKKYKLLHRWERFCTKIESIDRTESLLQTRLERIESELVQAHKRDSIFQAPYFDTSKHIIEEQDFQLYLRKTIITHRNTKKLDMFYKKFKWVSYSERRNLFQKAFDSESKKKDSDAPLMTTSLSDIEEQLEELKHCFDLTQAYDDNGQEFLFRVGKRFTAVFNAQSESWNFLVYPLQTADKDTASKLDKSSNNEDEEEFGRVQKGPTVTEGIYLKPATWTNYTQIEPRISMWQEEQVVELREMDAIDIHLNVETRFLQTTDLGYATKRLKEQAENHIQRAFVKKQFDSNLAVDWDTLELEGGKTTFNKVSAVYLLRFIRIREFKRKLLDILNFFRSVERRITMDDYGTTFKDHSPSFVRQFFLDPSDLKDHGDSNFEAHFAMNRDDTYHLDKKKDLLVKDAFGITVVYDVALKDLESLEDRLIRTGTHFISKNIDKRNEDLQIDRTLVLEDLYESETWFQDGKRKIVDCYLEAYEHCQDLNEQKHLAQVILDVMYSVPTLDFNALYFTEAYASEIITLELKYSLLKDIGTTLMKDERVYVRQLMKNYHSALARKIDPGIPDEIQSDDKERMISLFPGSSHVGLLDFYSSLAHIAYLEEYLDMSVRDIATSFYIANPVAINSLKRTILQQAIVEWKLLAAEEKIHKDLRLRMTDERIAVEEIIILEQPEDFLNLLEEVVQEETKVAIPSSSKFSGRDQLSSTEGGYDQSQTGFVLCQIYSNAIEMLFLWKNLLDELYETDVLQRVYFEQAQLAGKKLSQVSLEPVQFDEEESQLSKPIEVISLKTQTFSNIAITEFDKSMVDLNFSTLEGVKKLLHTVGLDELRQVFQFQLTQKTLLQITVKFNQIPIDELYVSSQYSSFFITAVSTKSPYDVNKSSTMDESTLKDVFLNINALKYPARKKALDHYQRVSSESILKGTRTAMLKKKLRELKFKLSKDYCNEVISAIQPFLLRYELTILSNELRGLIYQMSEDCGFTIGKEEHSANKHLIGKDGQVINPLYIPHFMQILNIKFIHLADDDPEDDPTIENLTFLYDIFQRNYAYILFASAHHQLSMPSKLVLSKGVMSQEHIAAVMRRFSSELNHLRQPENALSIINYITQKCEVLFKKTVLTLKHLEKKLLLSNQPYQGLAAIRKTLDILHNKQHITMNTPYWQHWPNIAILPEEIRRDYQELETQPKISILPFQFLKRFLLVLNESERNYYNVEEMNIELLLEDLLQEESLYSTSMPEKATTVQLEFLEQSVIIWQLKEHFLKLIEKTIDPETYKDPKKLEDLFYVTITRKAKRLYDKELKIREMLIQQRSMVSPEFSNEIQAKKRREIDFRKKQCIVITQELNKILLNDSIYQIRADCTQIKTELKRMNESSSSSELAKTDAKDSIFRNFVALMMNRSVKTRNKANEVEVTVFEKDLELALDEVARRLFEWNEATIADIKRSATSVIDSLKRNTFNLELRLLHQQFLRELDKNSFKRRVKAELADKNYDLIFRVDSLTRQNNSLESELENVAETIRREQQIKYEDTITKLEKELILMKGKFVEYKRKFYKDMENKFAEVKDTALIEIAKQKDGPNSFKKKALQIVMEDNELSKMKMRIEKLKAQRHQGAVLYKLKLIALESKYQKKIREAEEEKEQVKKKFFGNTEKIEAREQMLRKELLKTQEILNNTEMEVEQLKKDLQLQIKNKQKLVNWKVKNAQLLDELEEKVDKYERWNQFDVDKLVLELEKTKKEVQQYNKLRTRVDKKTELVEHKSKRTIESLKRQLQKEKKMKTKAIGKLSEVLDENENGSDGPAGEWQKKYFDAVSELQSAYREMEVMRNYMEINGLDIPESEDARIGEQLGYLTSRTDASSRQTRPSSAVSTKSYASRVTVGTPKAGIPQLRGPFDTDRGYKTRSNNSPPRHPQSAMSATGPDKPRKPQLRMIASAGTNRPMTLIPNYENQQQTMKRPSSASVTRGRKATGPATPTLAQRPSTSVVRPAFHPTLRRAASATVNRRGSIPDLQGTSMTPRMDTSTA